MTYRVTLYICVCMMPVQRLSSAPIPFTVLSIAGSTCNEDYLAVCGLKVFTFIVTLLYISFFIISIWTVL